MPETVISALDENYAQIKTIKASDVSLVATASRQGRISESPTLGGVLALEPRLPALWLRTEKIGQQIFTLRVKEGQFWLAIPDTRELVTGTGRALEKMPYVLRPQELAALAGSPENLGLRRSSTIMVTDGDDYRFDVWDGNTMARQVFVDRKDLALRRVVYFDTAGHSLATVTLDEYDGYDDALLPHHLVIDRPQAGVRVELWLSEISLNTVSVEELRGLAAPLPRRGWRRINLDEQPVSDIRALQERQ